MIKDIIFESISSNCKGDLDDAFATEKALLDLVNDLGGDISAIRERCLNESHHRIHYNSDRKKMSTIFKISEQENLSRLHLKGAAEIVLKSCDYILNERG